MTEQIIAQSLRLRITALLSIQLGENEADKAACHDAYPSARMLSRLDLDRLVELSEQVPALASRSQEERVASLLSPEAAIYFDRHAWNTYNAYLLLIKAIERAWRLPLTVFDLRNAMLRLRRQCPDQALLETVLTGNFKDLSEPDMQRAKDLGIVIDGLWCPWMESHEVINPLFLPS